MGKLGPETIPLQASVHRDIERKLNLLSEHLGIKRSAVIALAITELAEAYDIKLRPEADPNQLEINFTTKETV